MVPAHLEKSGIVWNLKQPIQDLEMLLTLSGSLELLWNSIRSIIFSSAGHMTPTRLDIAGAAKRTY